MNKTSKSVLFLAALLVIAAALTLQSFQNAEAAHGGTLTATYSSGTLHVTIPYHGLHAGAGQLTVEVLDPEDAVLGRVERRVDVGAADRVAGARNPSSPSRSPSTTWSGTACAIASPTPIKTTPRCKAPNPSPRSCARP